MFFSRFIFGHLYLSYMYKTHTKMQFIPWAFRQCIVCYSAASNSCVIAILQKGTILLNFAVGPLRCNNGVNVLYIVENMKKQSLFLSESVISLQSECKYKVHTKYVLMTKTQFRKIKVGSARRQAWFLNVSASP